MGGGSGSRIMALGVPGGGTGGGLGPCMGWAHCSVVGKVGREAGLECRAGGGTSGGGRGAAMGTREGTAGRGRGRPPPSPLTSLCPLRPGAAGPPGSVGAPFGRAGPGPVLAAVRPFGRAFEALFGSVPPRRPTARPRLLRVPRQPRLLQLLDAPVRPRRALTVRPRCVKGSRRPASPRRAREGRGAAHGRSGVGIPPSQRAPLSGCGWGAMGAMGSGARPESPAAPQRGGMGGGVGGRREGVGRGHRSAVPPWGSRRRPLPVSVPPLQQLRRRGVLGLRGGLLRGVKVLGGAKGGRRGCQCGIDPKRGSAAHIIAGNPWRPLLGVPSPYHGGLPMASPPGGPISWRGGIPLGSGVVPHRCPPSMGRPALPPPHSRMGKEWGAPTALPP